MGLFGLTQTVQQGVSDVGNYNISFELSESTQSRLFHNLPERPYCTNDLSHGLSIKRKSIAFSHAYIQLNTPWAIMYLNFDVDSKDAPLAWEYAELPIPTFIVADPYSNHAHLTYEFYVPILIGENARRKPIQWLIAIKRVFTIALRADRHYVGLLAKNPNHYYWRVIDTGARYELVELWEAIGAQEANEALTTSRHIAPPDDTEGRNTFLFHSIRIFSYTIAHDCLNKPELYDKVLVALINRNIIEFPDNPLPENELRHTAKSISGFTWRNRHNITGQGGRHKRKTENAEDLRERQIQSAYSTHEVRKAETEAKVKKAIDAFLRTGRKITKAAIAREAGISRVAVSKDYSYLFPKV